MTRLHQIQTDVQFRSAEIVSAHGSWPCRKGCSDCCRQLAAEPRVSQDEWTRIVQAIGTLPESAAETISRRIRESAGHTRPVVCPLLDLDSGACLIYEARPIACRAYGFYVERDEVLGCSRIESVAKESADIVWGNHTALEARMEELGAVAELSVWLARGRA